MTAPTLIIDVPTGAALSNVAALRREVQGLGADLGRLGSAPSLSANPMAAMQKDMLASMKAVEASQGAFHIALDNMAQRSIARQAAAAKPPDVSGYHNMLRLQVAAENKAQTDIIAAKKVAQAQSEAALQADLEGYKNMLRLKVAAENKAQTDIAADRKVAQTASLADQARNASFVNASPISQAGRAKVAASALALGMSEVDAVTKYGSAVVSAARDVTAFSRSVGVGSGPLKSFSGDMHDAHAAARGLAGGFGALWLTYGRILPLLAGAGASAGILAIVSQGAQVQNTFESIRVLSDETAGAVSGLNAQMLEMARSGPFGPREIAEAMKTMSLAGLRAEEVSGSIRQVLQLSVAGDTSIKTSADVLTTVGTAFRLGAEHYGYIGDVISKTAAISKASVESVAAAFKSASVINSQFGVSLEDVGLAIAVLNNVGVTNSAAGTMMRNFYVDVLGRSPKVRKELESLAASIGVQSIAMDTATGKAKPLLEIYANISKAQAKLTPEAKATSTKNIFSDRGERLFSAMEGANTETGASNALAETAKAAKKTILEVLQDMQNQLNTSAGFMAISAAQMALTPLNQMKSVKSALDASLVESFQAVQPHVIALSARLKEIVGSEEFKQGIGRMAVALGDLAVGFVNNVNWIVPLVAGLGALKIALGVEALLGVMSLRAVALATNMEYLAVSTVAVTASKTLLAPSVLAAGAAFQSMGVQAAGAASATNLATKATGLLSGSLSVVARFLPGIGSALTFAYLGWELYSFWSGKSAAKTLEGETPRQALIKSLGVEIQLIRQTNEAKIAGLTLDQYKLQLAGKKAGEDGSIALNAARKEYNDAFLTREREQKSREQAGSGQFVLTPLRKYVDAEAAALLKLKVVNQLDIQEEEKLLASKHELGKLFDAQAKAAKALQAAHRIPKVRGTLDPGKDGPLDLAAKITDHKTSREKASIDVTALTTLNDQVKAEEDIAKAGFTRQAELNKARYDGLITSQGAYFAEIVRLNEAQDSTLSGMERERHRQAFAEIRLAAEASKKGYEDRAAANEKAAERKDKGGKVTVAPYDDYRAQIAGIAPIAELERQKELIRFNKFMGGLAATTAKREEDAGIKAQAALNQAKAENAAFWEKENLAIEKSAQLLAGRNALAGLPEEYLAQYEARNNATERLGVEALKLKKIYKDLVQAVADFDAQIAKEEGGTDLAWTPAALARREELRKAASEAGASVDTFEVKSTGRASAEGQTAFDEVIRRRSQTVKDSFADAVSTGLLKGGDEGGKAMKKWLEDFFINQPIQMAMRGLVSGGWEGAAKGFDSGGWGGLLKLFTGSGKTSAGSGGSGGVGLTAPAAAPVNFAKGSAFSDGVVDTPTAFRSGRGLGVLGEAGPEAIMPLSRDSSGRLGLSGGGGKSVIIQNNPTIQIDARTDQAVIAQMVGGALKENNRQLMDHLSEAGVLPR